MKVNIKIAGIFILLSQTDPDLVWILNENFPHQVLLIDVRTLDEFKNSHIIHDAVIFLSKDYLDINTKFVFPVSLHSP